MKYEEKVTYRTTASGGQETITEMVPVYNRLEKRAMRRRAMKDSPKAPSEKGVLHGLMFIVKHPTFCLIVVGLIAIFAVYMISSANSMLNELVEQYTSLTARKDDSKYSFDKRLFYITVNADGTKTVTFGYKSEIEQEAAEEAAEQSGETGTGVGTSVTLSADAEKVKELLAENGYSSKAEIMAYVYDFINPKLGTNAAIGLMANVANEGTLGMVEEKYYSEIKSHMNLTGGKWNRQVTTKSDIEYLRNYDAEKSLGFGAVQWSFGRRVALCDIYLDKLGNSTSVTNEIMMASEAEMICVELSPGTSYYNTVSSKVGTDTAENWAEAFCDYYEKPGGWCGKGSQMTNKGTSCQERRKTATSIATILKKLEE